MEKHQENVGTISNATQESSQKLTTALEKLFKDFFKFFEKGKEDQKVEIQRDGKTIASGVLRDGELKDVKGKIPATELAKLRQYMGADRGTDFGGENSKEFKILVNDKPLLHAQKGIVLQNDLPDKMRDQFRTPAAEQQKATAAPTASTTAPTAEKAQASNPDLRADLKKAGVDDRTIAEVERQVGQSKGRSPIVVVQQTLPKESALHRVMFAVKQAGNKVAGLFNSSEKSLKQDLRNLEVTQQAKQSLSQLSDRPPGERSWNGNTYQITEGKDGSLAIEAKGRGKILEFSKGRIEGKATEADLKNFKTLNKEIEKYNANEKTPQLAASGEHSR